MAKINTLWVPNLYYGTARILLTAASVGTIDNLTASAAELNILDGATLDVGELNILDGVTATTAEINKLAGVTATTAEINKLVGLTASTAELNILDGVTADAAELSILNGVTASTADLNKIAGITNGTQAAAKAVVPDSNVNIGVVKATEVHIGVSGSEVKINATPAELNYLDITTLGTGAASKAIVLDAGDDYTWPATGILTYGVLKDPAGTTLGATAAEINQVADRSALEHMITVSGAVTAGKQCVCLNHTVAIAATIATTVAHQGLFVIKAKLEPATTHTCVITTGTWDGTNKTATFADINDALVVYFDSAGNGTIVSNVGSVVLSA